MVCLQAVLLQCFIWISLKATGVQYEVTHVVNSMCAVQRSTVLVPCTYTHPNREQVIAAEWLHEKPPQENVSVSHDAAFEGRVNCTLSDAGNCSLLLRDLRESDAGIFHFVFTTASGRNWTSAQGIRLEVTGAEVEVKTQSDVVMEGDWIFFSCGSCIPSMTVPTYTWRKDGSVHSQYHGNNILDLESVTLEDRGRYSCIISGHEELNSTYVDIAIKPGCPPKNVSVSMSGSGKIVDSVTLSCSSVSKPPVRTYIWFKENQSSAVGSGQTFSAVQSGRFYCEAHNQYGSQRSESVLVAVQESSSSWIMITVGITTAVVLMSVILIVVIWLSMRHNKKVESPEDAYMTLDPKSRCSEYDTLDNVKRCCENTDSPEDQKSSYPAN